MVNLLAPFSRPFADVYADGAYVRFFAGEDPTSFVLLSVAKGRAGDVPLTPDCVRSHTRPVRKRREQRALAKLPAGELELHGGAWCAVRFEHGEPAEWIGETDGILWNGVEIKAFLACPNPPTASAPRSGSGR